MEPAGSRLGVAGLADIDGRGAGEVAEDGPGGRDAIFARRDREGPGGRRRRVAGWGDGAGVAEAAIGDRRPGAGGGEPGTAVVDDLDVGGEELARLGRRGGGGGARGGGGDEGEEPAAGAAEAARTACATVVSGGSGDSWAQSHPGPRAARRRGRGAWGPQGRGRPAWRRPPPWSRPGRSRSAGTTE